MIHGARYYRDVRSAIGSSSDIRCMVPLRSLLFLPNVLSGEGWRESCFFRMFLIGWLFGCLVAWLVGWIIGWFLGLLVVGGLVGILIQMVG